jgi:hypothetical protein
MGETELNGAAKPGVVHTGSGCTGTERRPRCGSHVRGRSGACVRLPRPRARARHRTKKRVRARRRATSRSSRQPGAVVPKQKGDGQPVTPAGKYTPPCRGAVPVRGLCVCAGQTFHTESIPKKRRIIIVHRPSPPHPRSLHACVRVTTQCMIFMHPSSRLGTQPVNFILYILRVRISQQQLMFEDVPRFSTWRGLSTPSKRVGGHARDPAGNRELRIALVSCDLLAAKKNWRR